MASKAIKNMVYSAGVKNAGIVRVIRPIEPKPNPNGIILVEFKPATTGTAQVGIWDFRMFVEECIDILNSLTDKPEPLPIVNSADTKAEDGQS